MGIRKRREAWLVTAEAGREVLDVRRRVTRTVDTDEEAGRLDVKLQHDISSGRHVQLSHEPVPTSCRRYLEARERRQGV